MLDYNGVGATLELWGVGFCVMAILCISLIRKSSPDEQRYGNFVPLFLVNGLALLFAATNNFMNGRPGTLVHVFLLINTPAEYIMNQALLTVLTCHIFELFSDRDWVKTWLHAVNMLFIVFAALVLFQMPFHWFYRIAEDNCYYRGDFYAISTLIAGIVLTGNIILSIVHAKQVERGMGGFLVIYMGLPVIAVILQVAIYGIPFLQITYVLVSFATFVGIHHLVSLRVMRQDREKEETEHRLMVAQLRPHFLYNVLLAIMDIEGNPPETVDAITSFSKYLRGTLNSLQEQDLIPASQELRHVQEYVKLEQLRFKGKLKVSLDIREDSFYLPPLSMQMLVENSIKHGFTNMDQNGEVHISTKLLDGWYVTTVEDNGCGFNPEEFLDGKNGHVGLYSVRQRVETMCGGKLVARSVSGRGARISILIPENAVKQQEEEKEQELNLQERFRQRRERRRQQRQQRQQRQKNEASR